MKIKSAEFITSALSQSQYPEELYPEIAFAGRSNVGKSSLMNALLNRKKLVKTSSTPGKTQMINFFLINQAFSFVDLPGYGYAKVPKNIRKQWKPMMENYFQIRSTLRLVVCLIDARRKISETDIQLMDFLEKYKKHRVLVFTKFDKLKKNEQNSFTNKMKKDYGLQSRDFFKISSARKEGLNDLWEELSSYLSDVL